MATTGPQRRRTVEVGKRRRTRLSRHSFEGTFPPTQCVLATFTESMVRSISEYLLAATVSWKAQGMHNSGVRGVCRATGRATYGAGSGKERS